MAESVETLTNKLAECDEQLKIQRRLAKTLGIPSGVRVYHQPHHSDMFATRDGTLTMYVTLPGYLNYLPIPPTDPPSMYCSMSVNITSQSTMVFLHEDQPVVYEAHPLTDLNAFPYEYEGIPVNETNALIQKASHGLINPKFQANVIGDEGDEHVELTVIGLRHLNPNELVHYTRLRELADSIVPIMTPDLVESWANCDRLRRELALTRTDLKSRIRGAEDRRILREARARGI